jgi:8-oxo-dGTP diphosphatase
VQYPARVNELALSLAPDAAAHAGISLSHGGKLCTVAYWSRRHGTRWSGTNSSHGSREAFRDLEPRHRRPEFPCRLARWLVRFQGHWGAEVSASRSGEKSRGRLTLAAAIVIHNDRVLIVRRSKKETFLPGKWGIPCGKVDNGEGERRRRRRTEPARDAVVRELREETGLSGKVIKQVGSQTFNSNWRGRDTLNVQYNYLVSLKPNDIEDQVGWHALWHRLRRRQMPLVKPPMRDQVYKWVQLSKLDEESLDSHNREAIRQALDAYAVDRPAISDIMESSLSR